MSQAVRYTDMLGLKARGKVRDIYDLGDRLMIVASDRISAFDVVMDDPVPGKGRLLTQMSKFWLETLPACTPHHLDYVVSRDRVPAGYEQFAEQLDGRSMVVKKAVVLPIECVVRGYIVGGGWKEYQQVGAISGIKLPAGLRLADKLPEPIFTPSTKAASGHDEPISFDRACEILQGPTPQASPSWFPAMMAKVVPFDREYGRRLMMEARNRSLAIYAQAAQHAAARGIIIADTKFEFGLHVGPERTELILIDEALTPDSSRFWPADAWQPGTNPPSYDKQFLRDYLETLTWQKLPPPPPIPADVIERTLAKYREACERLTQ